MRRDSMPAEIVGIQMLRALAAVMVVAHHALETSNGFEGSFSPDWLTVGGAAGVDIFFVISGFIMLYTSYDSRAEPITMVDFLWKRFSRIYPIYWACCFGILAVTPVGYFKNHPVHFSDVLKSFILWPTAHPLLSVSWTLVYEVYFYFIFALSLLFRSRTLSCIATTILVAMMISIGWLMPAGALRDFLINPIPLEFCGGLWLAWSASLSSRRLPVWTCVVALAAFFSAPMFIAHTGTAGLTGSARVVVWGAPAILIVAAFLAVGAPTQPLIRFAERLGNASYALYLTHPFVMIGYGLMLKRPQIQALDQAPFVGVTVCISVLLAFMVHSHFERPLASALKRLTGRSPGAASPTEALDMPPSQ